MVKFEIFSEFNEKQEAKVKKYDFEKRNQFLSQLKKILKIIGIELQIYYS